MWDKLFPSITYLYNYGVELSAILTLKGNVSKNNDHLMIKAQYNNYSVAVFSSKIDLTYATTLHVICSIPVKRDEGIFIKDSMSFYNSEDDCKQNFRLVTDSTIPEELVFTLSDDAKGEYYLQIYSGGDIKVLGHLLIYAVWFE